ncbi:hypothetical protein DFH09DRAFT_1459036 [Mycena vulgaris]|nr:hypothetical protein DFH09DRAFT_1459036 [Mycena vulgaris]
MAISMHVAFPSQQLAVKPGAMHTAANVSGFKNRTIIDPIDPTKPLPGTLSPVTPQDFFKKGQLFSTSSVTLRDNQGNTFIPVVDFTPFLDDSNKQGVADEILSSFKRVGFVYLVNHRLPQDQIANMFSVSKKFFAQSVEIKELINTASTLGSSPSRYLAQPINAVGLNLATPQDTLLPEERKSPNRILPGFKEVPQLCREVEMNVLRALAVGFGLLEDYLTLVPAEAIRNERVGRITADSDYASLTLLLQDDVGGLEIEDPNVTGLFRHAASTIDPRHNHCQRGGFYDAVVKRHDKKHRSSRDREIIVDCIPGTWDQENPKKYEPISVGLHLRSSFASAAEQVTSIFDPCLRHGSSPAHGGFRERRRAAARLRSRRAAPPMGRHGEIRGRESRQRQLDSRQQHLDNTSFTTRAFGTADLLRSRPFLRQGDSLLGLCPKPRGAGFASL